MLCLNLTGVKSINFLNPETQEQFVKPMCDLVQIVGHLAGCRKLREDSFLLNFGIEIMARQLIDAYDYPTDDKGAKET
jgi:hypothetical protein